MLAARLLPVLLGVLFTSGSLGAPTVQTSLPPTSTVPLAARIAALLPKPNQAAQVVKFGSRIAAVDLQEKVIEAGGSRRALQNVLAVIAQGGVPSYDENLGISRAEFGKYLAFQPVILPTGKSVKLPVVREATRLIFGDAPGMNGVLKNVSIDLNTAELRVPEGFAVRPVAVTPSSAPDRSIDIRSAYTWTFNPSYNAKTQSGINGQMQLFLLGNGQVLLIYKRTSMLKGVVNEGNLMLSYARP